MIKQYDEIVDVKNQIFNVTLLVGTILGLTTFLLSLRNFHESEVQINYLLNLLTIVMFLVVYLLRKKLTQSFKSFVVIVGLFILSFIDIYKLGTYSTAKTLLVLIPFFSLIAFSYRRIIFYSVLSILLYIFFAFQFTSEAFSLTVDLNFRNLNFSSWLVNLSILVIVAYAIMIIVSKYNKAFYKLIDNLEEQNVELQAHRENLEVLVAERSADLEAANEELSATNEELYQSNSIIEAQNQELKSTLDHLKETQSKLVQSEKMASLGVLSAGVAHEINNPLNFIMGGYNGIENCLNSPEDCDKENIPLYLNIIKTGVERASEIVKALNLFSRSNESYSETCDIHSIIDNSLIILTNQYKNRIEVIKEYDPESVVASGNVSKLLQVFLNVLTNSIHAIEDEGKITVKTRRNNEYAVVVITDSGCGICKENLSKVTDPFFTTKDPGKGTGLGLSIAYKIIQEHKGILNINSEEGKGTVVEVELPLKK